MRRAGRTEHDRGDAQGLPVETGVFSGTAPDEYVVITPISEHFELYCDDYPGLNIEEARLSLFSRETTTKEGPARAHAARGRIHCG